MIVDMYTVHIYIYIVYIIYICCGYVGVFITGGSPTWMVSFMENPIQKWMITCFRVPSFQDDLGVPEYLHLRSTHGNLHIE